MRRRGGPRGAAVAVLTALLAAAAPAAMAAPEGAVQGWTPAGTSVRGAPSGTGAPVLAAGSTYRDTLAKGATKYYAVQLGAVSNRGGTAGGGASDTGGALGAVTSYLSAFAVPRPGSHVGFLDGITLRLQTADGTICDSYDARFAGDDASAPVGGLVRRPGAADDVCRTAGRYLLSVRRESAAGSDGDVWPLDVRYMAEPGLATLPAVRPVPTYSSASPAPGAGAGAPARVTGAAGMDGTGLRLPGNGLYLDHLEPGVTRYYRVPVDWGQRLSATAEFGDATVTGSGGFSVSGLRVAVFSPARGYVDGQPASYTGRHTAVSAQTPEVDYDNRLSSDSRVNASAVAGWYYVQVSLHPAVAQFTTGGVDVTLRLKVAGAARPGPDYRGSLAAAGFGVFGPAPKVTGLSRVMPVTAGTAPAGHPVRRAGSYVAFGLAAVFLVWPTLLLRRARRAVDGH